VIAKAGSPIEYLDAPEFQTYWDADAAEMTKAVRAGRQGRVSQAGGDEHLSERCHTAPICPAGGQADSTAAESTL
jgi:hypothetical protein